MQCFSDIERNKLMVEDIMYSEVFALMFMNPDFFTFLNDERWKYLLNNNVFNMSLNFEYDKYSINIEKVKIFLNIEKDWDSLKKCYEISFLLKEKIGEITNVFVKSKEISFYKNEEYFIFRDRLITDTITLYDLEWFTGIQLNTLYTTNIDSLVNMFILHIKTYLKPDYLNGLLFFLDIFWERRLEINWFNYNNFKLDNLGFKKEDMPKLYYNSLIEFCKDIINIKEAFRDYDLMLETWKSIKNNNLNKDYLLKIFKQSIDSKKYPEFLSKYYSLNEKDYFYVNKDNLLLHLPSKEEFLKRFENNINILYKTNDIKDMVICFIWGDIEMRLKVEFGLAPSTLNYSVIAIENKKNIKLD